MAKIENNQYRHAGYTFQVVWRDDAYAIAESAMPCAPFEVFRINHQEPSVSVVAGRRIERDGGEYTPTAREWGLNGRTYATREQCERWIREEKQAKKPVCSKEA